MKESKAPPPSPEKNVKEENKVKEKKEKTDKMQLEAPEGTALALH